VDSNLWHTAWDESTEEQREALSDGELTFAEYEAAATRTVRCLGDAGLQGEAVLDHNSQTYALGARWQSSGDRADDEEKRAATERCYANHWNGISQAWTAQSTPTESEIDAARQAMAQCMREGGLDVPVPASSQDILRHQAHEVYAACARRIAEEHGLPNFGG
jgi:hypothetical protein